jgi:hypothetical protein
LDTLLIKTTSSSTTSTPITVQVHIPPPIHPSWIIVEPLSLRYDQPTGGNPGRERRQECRLKLAATESL